MWRDNQPHGYNRQILLQADRILGHSRRSYFDLILGYSGAILGWCCADLISTLFRVRAGRSYFDLISGYSRPILGRSYADLISILFRVAAGRS